MSTWQVTDTDGHLIYVDAKFYAFNESMQMHVLHSVNMTEENPAQTEDNQPLALFNPSAVVSIVREVPEQRADGLCAAELHLASDDIGMNLACQLPAGHDGSHQMPVNDDAVGKYRWTTE